MAKERNHLDRTRDVAQAQLAFQHYVALRVGLEGTYSAGLQILFGGITIVIGTLAYLFFPDIPFQGRVIAHWVVEPTAVMATLLSIVLVLLPKEKRSISQTALMSASASLTSDAPLHDKALSTLGLVISEASVVLDRRERGLRTALMVAAGWAVFSSIAVWLLLRFEPSWIYLLEGARQRL